MTTEERIRIISQRIDELNNEIEKLRIERARLIDGEQILGVDVIDVLPRKVLVLFEDLGIYNDEKLQKFISGKYRKEDINNPKRLYFNAYIEASTIEERLQAIYGMGPKTIEKTVQILKLKNISDQGT